MTNTIEVPISLIKAGDLDAIRELLPNAKLFGRWATHIRLGRGIIISAHSEQDDLVRFAYKDRECAKGADWNPVHPDDLTLDPVELTTVEDFQNAPLGTVVAESRGDAYQKTDTDDWGSRDCRANTKIMATIGPWKILRWGKGE